MYVPWHRTSVRLIHKLGHETFISKLHLIKIGNAFKDLSARIPTGPFNENVVNVFTYPQAQIF